MTQQLHGSPQDVLKHLENKKTSQIPFLFKISNIYIRALSTRNQPFSTNTTNLLAGRTYSALLCRMSILRTFPLLLLWAYVATLTFHLFFCLAIIPHRNSHIAFLMTISNDFEGYSFFHLDQNSLLRC